LTNQLENANAELLALKDALKLAQGEAESSQRLIAEWSKKADQERKQRLTLATQAKDLLDAQETLQKQKW